jgi:uncharacterized protein (DUF305 family)
MSFLDQSNRFMSPFNRVTNRRRGFLAACVLACALPLPVFSQRADPKKPVVVQPGAPGQPTRTLPSTTRAELPPLSPADVHFMQGMIMHHAQAVEMTALIESHTDNHELLALGDRISRSQAAEIEFMKRWLTVRGVSTSPLTPHGHQMEGATSGHQMRHPDGAPAPIDHMLMPGMLSAKQMEALRKAKGKEFESLFLSGMIQHHNGALAMVKELFDTAGAGQDAELFNFATDVDSGQRAEIRVMQKMLGNSP